ncbi:hypothetical protein [Pseudomonas citronellolis]|uniref:hypothetical protein n=1 Tax=Pseudomonas citronellolis TaxID=53408 RepID=UPI0023E47873|nr:hypothetical protein [Pseudomonas citronellolis]MDF3934668.1 hypothetical protein [Pseudomonas citronellolis]
MGLNDAGQRLRRELLNMAFRHEGLATDLSRSAGQLPASQAEHLVRMAAFLQRDAERLIAIAEQVRGGSISVADGP